MIDDWFYLSASRVKAKFGIRGHHGAGASHVTKTLITGLEVRVLIFAGLRHSSGA